MLIKLIEDEWNEEYDEVLEKLKSVINPDSLIVFFSDCAFAFDFNNKSQDELIEAMHKRLSEGRSNMPDFSFNSIDEFRFGVVQLDNGGICAIVNEEECKFNEEGKAEPEFISLMIARARCQLACENDRIVAIYKPE